MCDKDKHMEGFEKEATLAGMYIHPEVSKLLFKWRDFMAVACIVNAELCKEAFDRRSCERTLRYIGYDNWDESVRPKKSTEPYVYGNIYHSIDFNGATYTIKETGQVTGKAYFEVVG